MHLKRLSQAGDTIIEVFIAITIAGLAIGTSYAIASRAVRTAISARERDTAVGLLESQVSALKLREQLTDSATFVDKFTVGHHAPAHFCLDASASGPLDVNWLPKENLNSEPLQPSSTDPPTSPSKPYNPFCNPPSASSEFYFIDITTIPDNTSATPTIYQLSVRWPHIGGGSDNVATFYYRF